MKQWERILMLLGAGSALLAGIGACIAPEVPRLAESAWPFVATILWLVLLAEKTGRK